MPKNKKELVLAFDLGNVVFNFDYNIALDKIKDRLVVTPKEVIRELYYNNFTIPFEKGLVSGYSFYQRFKKTFLAELAYKEFIDIWCKIFWPNYQTINLIKNLKYNFPIYLISNINRLHFDYLYREYPSIFSLFRELILSFKVKYVKPEIEIYQTLQKKTGVDFTKIIYIDDRLDLIQEAEKLGLRCLLFTDTKQLMKDLKDLKIFI
ncbi:MAG: HAD-IA family hydrolase [Candidatus Omnitrophica bacterium]|jgi:FMN phosphatase YigB (HAD superfamily)|nr:HAD-IA family hydrolase [Candidatus Omnitrophota bacterium]